METCPHGARITCGTDTPVQFLDPCVECEALLADLGFARTATFVPRREPAALAV